MECFRAHLTVIHQYRTQNRSDVVPGPVHEAAAVRFFLFHKAHGVERKKAWVRFISLFHTVENPLDTVGKAVKSGILVRNMENFLPDAFYCSGNQSRLGIKIVVDGSHGNAAGRGDRADIDSRPSLFLNQPPAYA